MSNKQKRGADTRRRIDALMRTLCWVESLRDYKRVTGVVDRVAAIDEHELSSGNPEKLERLSQLVVAYDAGLMSRT